MTAFEPHVAFENDEYFVCTNPKCERVFQFGSPESCPMCGSAVEMRIQDVFVAHGRKQYDAGCRCEVCRAANTLWIRERRAKRRAQGIDESMHGHRYTYTTLRCRCDACRRANADYRHEQRALLGTRLTDVRARR